MTRPFASARRSVGEIHGLGGASRRLAAILLAARTTVAIHVVAQAVLPTSVRSIGRRTRGTNERRRTFWISLGTGVPLSFGH